MWHGRADDAIDPNGAGEPCTFVMWGGGPQPE